MSDIVRGSRIRNVCIFDANGDPWSSTNPIPVDFPAGGGDVNVHDKDGTGITSTSENGDQALDCHLSNSTIEQTTGAAHNNLNIVIGGKDGSNNVQPPLLDASTRRLSTDVNSSALPTGAATETTLDEAKDFLDTISGNITECDTANVVATVIDQPRHGARTVAGVTVSTSAVLLAAASDRLHIEITNNGPGNLFIGSDNTVTTSGATMGQKVIKDGAFWMDAMGIYTGDLYGIYSEVSASQNVSVAEVDRAD